MLEKIARFISALFTPLLVPTYGMIIALWTTIMCYVPLSSRIAVVVITAIFTYLLPLTALISLIKIGHVSGFSLANRKERLFPYVIVLCCYLGCSFYLYQAQAPIWIVLFLMGAALAALISCVVNVWWKISIHSASMAGIVALSLRIAIDEMNVSNMMPIIVCGVLAWGIVGTSRLILERHTLWQVIAGGVNGFLCVYLLSAL